MKVNLRRIFVLAVALCAILPGAVKAQKGRIPVDKPVSNPRIPADDISKPNNALPPDLSPLELAVVEEINLARRDPQKFAGFLQEYQNATRGNLISLPGRIPLRTIEGAPVIEEAIGDLKLVSDLDAFEISVKLSDAARMQLRDLQEDSSLGHKGKNGSTLKMRLAQFVAVQGKSAENICFRARTARDVVTTFLIDDGVKSRLHRKNVLSPAYKKVGIACGVGNNNEPLCVTVFAEDYKELNTASKYTEF